MGEPREYVCDECKVLHEERTMYDPQGWKKEAFWLQHYSTNLVLHFCSSRCQAQWNKKHIK